MTFRHFPLSFVFLLIAAGFVGGCTILGAVAGKTLPEPKAPAAFDLGEQATAVRVVADERLLGETAALGDTDPVLVATRRQLRERTEANVVTSTADANQIVVIELLPTSERTVIGSDYSPGVAAGRVRVLDAEGEELWPRDGSAGQVVQAKLPPATAGSPEEIHREALRSLGRRVALLFYPHTAEEAFDS